MFKGPLLLLMILIFGMPDLIFTLKCFTKLKKISELTDILKIQHKKQIFNELKKFVFYYILSMFCMVMLSFISPDTNFYIEMIIAQNLSLIYYFTCFRYLVHRKRFNTTLSKKQIIANFCISVIILTITSVMIMVLGIIHINNPNDEIINIAINIPIPALLSSIAIITTLIFLAITIRFLIAIKKVL